MGGAHSQRRSVSFGLFEADFRAGELRKRGIKVKLQDQPLQILQMLLEHPGEIVTRDELRQIIWPADTFVDFEQGLYNAVRRLRDALKDSADKPHFIETLSRRGYRFIGTINPTPRQIQSLAVLPLENLSRDPEQEYLAEGLTEALITTLAKIGQLRVVSRTSVMRYKGVHKPLREIARELEVDAIVEGTVLRADDRVRITAQLIDAPRETHLWVESYERDLRDVLTLQAEVAQAIAQAIQVQLTPQEKAHFAQMHAVDPEAYEAYLRGRYQWNQRSGDGLKKATQWFRQAISKDPTYAVAYAGLADCLSILGWWSFVSPDDGCGRAKELAQQALKLDRSLPEAHASLAWATMLYDYDFVSAEREFERSIELNPRYATAHSWFGVGLALMGRFEESYTELGRAIRLDPHPIMNQALGFVLFLGRKYDQAIEQLGRSIEGDASLAQAHSVLGLTYAYKSMHGSAIAAARKAVELSEGAPLFTTILGVAYAMAGYRDDALKTLQRLRELSKQRYVSAYPVAHLYAALRERDEAFRWLEAAYLERAALLLMLKTDPGFDDLRPDPRFQDLLRRMNFP